MSKLGGLIHGDTLLQPTVDMLDRALFSTSYSVKKGVLVAFWQVRALKASNNVANSTISRITKAVLSSENMAIRLNKQKLESHGVCL